MNGNAFNSQFDSDDVKFEEINRRYSGFFKIDEYVFQHALFEGGVSDIVKREILERGDAVAVLPNREKNLGRVRDDQFIVTAERRSAGGVDLDVLVVEKDDPRIQGSQLPTHENPQTVEIKPSRFE